MSPERRELDADNDGVVSDAEIQAAKASSDLLKQDSQRRMAWIAMMSMLVFTALVFLPIFPDSRIKALGDLFSLFYIGMAGVVSAYFGAAAFMARKK
tara:strand:- start:1874 stop:2164 length:291 start_codon:yes stop_codon:yes gene_type:complete